MGPIGILTGGGDCPGLNGVIRAIVRRAPSHRLQAIGFRRGWQGLLDDDFDELTLDAVAGTLPRGGTILGTSRVDPYTEPGIRERIFECVRKRGLSGLVVVGGEGTLRATASMVESGLAAVGVPKTIDNDVAGTDRTIGFDTAVSIASDAIDRLHTTAESHDRVMVVEVMGRKAGWIAVTSGIAAGADIVVIPEFPMPLAEIARIIETRRRRDRSFSIVVVAEGARPLLDDGTPIAVSSYGIGHALASAIGGLTGHETRVTVLGHVQRGGTPTAVDRVLATRMGVLACDLVARGETGVMTALNGDEVRPVALSIVRQEHCVGLEWYRLAEVFFG